MASTPAGMVRLNALAVLRLMTKHAQAAAEPKSGPQRRSARAGARAHDEEFAECIASAGRDRDGRFAEVHLGKIPHQRLVERVIKTGSNDLRFEQRGNPIEPFEQFAQISGQIRHANPSYRRLRLPRKRWKVLGVDLNRSECGRWQLLRPWESRPPPRCQLRVNERTRSRGSALRAKAGASDAPDAVIG